MDEKKLKIITIVGTRPEIIRLSLVMKKLDTYTNHITVHTGQNYDYELNEIFYRDLGLRKPDYYLGIDTRSLGTALGETLIKVEEVFLKEKPDAVLILGDTNASITAVLAKRMHIPIYHMEAGNRSFDLNVPEEINRRIIDHLADFNLPYTENSRSHLLAEGLPHRRIYVSGSPMFEILTHYRDKIEKSSILKTLNLQPQNYFLVSAHREENVDNPENLKRIIAVLNALAEAYNVPIIVSTHPRTRNRLDNLSGMQVDDRIQYLKPFGFFDYNFLQMNAICAVSDSGTISEESAILDFPAVTIRNSMERPEAIDAGSIVLAGLTTNRILDAINLVVDEYKAGEKKDVCSEYLVTNTASRVVRLILGTASLSNKWWGIA
ncbi:MAG: UDP-N-acetylglucosamine 2-epimerase (non-hydrolyzing) [Deferribacteres bacterium]|nr:UDP-N-acetylglucosamine 2-epimerase (non-hydrolyzing) [candidate division KSB1 bacterium]MCB9501744.1 UDP-N-acetylglucosamine 2-epimerase (non-hydrolyzing) [Deferribacteres bacterium]